MVQDSAVKAREIRLEVDKISCQGCVNSIERNLEGLEGVESVRANLADSSVTVRFFPAIFDFQAIKNRLDEINYPVRTKSVRLDVEGMHCASCVSRIEKELSKAEGITGISINLAEQTANVEYVEPLISQKLILKKIEESGYKASVKGATDVRSGEGDYYQALRRNFRFALPLTVLIFFISHLEMFGISPLGQSIMFYILLALAIPVQFYCGRQFYSGFWKSLRLFSASMDTLVAVGTSAAFIYSLIATFIPSLLTSADQTVAVYYDTAAIIITLILLGRLLESRARRATSYEIEKLVRLESKSATVVRNGNEVEIDRTEVRPGDIVVMKPGGKLPVDGVVIDGFSALDESMLTGEPLPREIKKDDKVLAGSINRSGSFRYKALAVGDETVIGKIVESVRQIISSRAPIQRLADRVAAVFVPAVIAIALLAFLLWVIIPSQTDITFALMIFIAVLIIACPCALGLATPAAIMVGSARGAREGILIKSAEVLERVHKIDTVVFDKTGTLSLGKPHVEKFINLGSEDENKLIGYAAALEKASEHPLAEAVIAYAAGKNIEPEKIDRFDSFPGRGLKGSLKGVTIHLGNQAFLKSEGIEFEGMADINSKFKLEGRTVLFLAIDHRTEALIAVSDQIKLEAEEVIAELKKSGRSVWMLSGDNKAAAEAVGKQLGIDSILAEVLPHEKAEQIASLKAMGRHVAMVGDGVNDAPALAEADIGIALGSGTDVAVSFSDITLIGSNLNGVAKALWLSEITLKTIKQNLWWAFGYNIIAIPVAAGVLYPALGLLLSPIIASAAMAFSSIFVISNSLRLRNIKL
jgi:Cu+-exporting ATPase